MALGLRQRFLLVMVFTLSLQTLRPALAMNCGCETTSQQSGQTRDVPARCCCDNPEFDPKPCCCCEDNGSSTPMESASRCRCTHDEVPLPAVPASTHHNIVAVVLSMLACPSQSFNLLIHNNQIYVGMNALVNEIHLSHFVQVCYSHWLI